MNVAHGQLFERIEKTSQAFLEHGLQLLEGVVASVGWCRRLGEAIEFQFWFGARGTDNDFRNLVVRKMVYQYITARPVDISKVAAGCGIGDRARLPIDDRG